MIQHVKMCIMISHIKGNWGAYYGYQERLLCRYFNGNVKQRRGVYQRHSLCIGQKVLINWKKIRS
jgi:hypothetical protein